MSRAKAKKKIKLKPRFFVFCALILVLIIAVIASCSGRKIPESDPESPVYSEKLPDPSGPEESEDTGDTLKPMTTTLEYPVSTVTDDYLILVNKTHHVTEEYYPGDMVTVTSLVEGVGTAETKQLRGIAAEALEKLIKGASDAGYQIKMRTGFRSYSYQANLFKSYSDKNGEAAANKYSARAGESEHQTGLCCDVSSPSSKWALSYEYDETPEGSWLASHAHEYGFIIRYPEGKEDITGYVYEPWHIRYVGKEAAAIIYKDEICYEEYLGILD